MNLKQLVGYEAAKLVTDGCVVGLGTGSTTHYFIEKLAKRVWEEEMDVLAVPTSYQSLFLAERQGIPLTTLNEYSVDLAVDGADEVDPLRNLIKGGGAAHTLEKIVDSSAERFVVIVDESKVVNQLGKFPVPVEVIPQAFRVVREELEGMGGTPELRMAEKKDGPVITDNGNFVVDVDFGLITEPEVLEVELNNVPGVVENGIFTGVADDVLVGTSQGVQHVR